MTIENVIVNKDRLSNVIQTVLQAQENRIHVFSKDQISPEEPFIALLIEHGNKIRNSAFAPNALFLTVSLIRGNKTGPFLTTLTDQERIIQHAWIFMPEEVLSRGEKETEKACMSFFEPPGYCRDVLSKWTHNCQILRQNNGDIRIFFDRHNGDAEEIAKAIFVRNRAKTWEKTNKSTFLGYGPKLTYLALQWISLYGLYDFKNIKNLPVDFQIARIAIQTNAITFPNGEANVDSVITRNLLPAIREICSEKNIDPREVSQTLWALGSRACNKKLHLNCPLENTCQIYITSNYYQRTGKFKAEDEGRYR